MRTDKFAPRNRAFFRWLAIPAAGILAQCISIILDRMVVLGGATDFVSRLLDALSLAAFFMAILVLFPDGNIRRNEDVPLLPKESSGTYAPPTFSSEIPYNQCEFPFEKHIDPY